MRDVHRVIRRPIITEKSTMLRELENQVVFEIDREANKNDVKRAVEELFGAKVASVNTMIVAGKPKRFGRIFGHRAGWKKAIVTLREGEELDFFEATELGEEEFPEGAEV